MNYLCGMKLHFKKTGTGKPVVILHGLFGSSDNWQTFGKELAASGYAVYLVDLRNHGLSPHDEVMNYETFSNDLFDLFTDESLKDVVLIGHSLGGKTAMSFSFRYPELIIGLVVIDIAPRSYPVHHRNILDALLSIDTVKIQSRKDIESQLASRIDDAPTLQFLMKNLFWKEKERLDWRFNLSAINTNIDLIGARTAPGSPFKKPTLFIKGANSNYISPGDEKEIADSFTAVEVITAPEAGHWVHADNPQWLLTEIKSFISELQ